jgi:hypothetical protein
VGLRAGLDKCGKSRPTGIRSPDRPARRQSLYRLRYPTHTLTFIIIIIIIVIITIISVVKNWMRGCGLNQIGSS